jgi:hypothetical protein
MSKLKINLSKVPSEYQKQMFANLVNVRGVEGGLQAVVEDITLSSAFPWVLSPEGHDFWEAISEGKSPDVTVTSTTVSSELEEVIKEAEQRGFANGVNTKWGQIKDEYKPGYGIQPHELLPDGTFFYRNIKVRRADGKWIKPLSSPTETISKVGDEAAIHAFIERLVKTISSN